MIRITAKKDGFRRAGVAHSKEPQEYPDDRFSEKERAALQAEPNLVVEIVEEKNVDKVLSAEELIEQIGKAATLAEINALLPKGEKRKTVKAAAEERGKQLAAASSEGNAAE